MSTDADRPQPAAPGNTLAPPDPGPPVPTGTTDTLNSNALLERPSAQPPSATRTDDATSGEQPNRIRCPHCQNPIDIADRRADEILCPGCGSSFHLRDARHTDTTSTSRPLGKFQLLERVGVGAFGAVWKARDTELDRIVALKIPHSGLLSEGQELERFHREARAAAQLRHPNIVPVHAVLTLEGLPTIVADFIDGVPLRDFLSGRRPTFREAAALIADIADALEYAHCRGLVHRDVKPANVMLERDPARRGGVGRPLLMDFGLALRDGAEVTLTLDGHVIGTPAYMSPEQASGKSHNADRRSDVYSLGVVLYELLTGELPFRGTKMMILHQVLQEEPRPPRKVNDKVPHDLETVCLKCLEKEPSRRYPTAGELAADLRRYLAGEPVHARPAGRVEKAVKWARRRPALAGLLGVTVLGLVALAVLSASLAVARNGAEREADKARKARDFLVSIFELSDANGQRGTMTARQILDDAEKQIPKEFADQPEVQAELLAAIEGVYAKLTANAPLAMILEARGAVQLQSSRNANRQPVPQTLLYAGDRLSLAADGHVRLVVLSDLHQERLRPGTEATVRRKGCEPADAVGERNQDIPMTFVRLPKGTFYMGWDGTKKGTKTEITEDFEIAVHTVTQGQWQAVMGNNPSHFSRFGASRNDVKDISDEELKLFPVESVSWDDAQEFIKKLNEKARGRGYLYRLPTESEWEYACRGGATSEKECSYHFYVTKPTNDLSSDQANFNGDEPFGKTPKGKYLGRPTRVGAYPPNQLGLCDMHGNVWQWCADEYHRAKERTMLAASTLGVVASPSGQSPFLAATAMIDGHNAFSMGSDRVYRGGGWCYDGSYCQAAIRGWDSPSGRNFVLGFRLARVPVR